MTAPIIALAPNPTPEEVAAYVAALRADAARLLATGNVRVRTLAAAILVDAANVEWLYGGGAA